jgi:hypothetical protein
VGYFYLVLAKTGRDFAAECGGQKMQPVRFANGLSVLQAACWCFAVC